MKTARAIALVLSALLLLGCLGVYAYMQGLGDLRTEHAKAHGPSAGAQERGRSVLARSIDELGGADRWNQLREQEVQVTFRHTWRHPLLRVLFMPLEFSGQRLSLLLRPADLDARLTFLDGEWSGQAWGMSGGKAYRVDADGSLSWEPDRTIEFHVPSYRYLFFLPFYLSEAERITYAGTGELHGRTYDLVYATWGQWAPHRGADQYLVWIDRETARIDFVQCTVREMFPRSISSFALSDYRDVLGIRLPCRWRLLEDIEVLDAGMHAIDVLQISTTDGAGTLDPP